MIVLELIGWAFIGGCMVGAFIAPIYLVDRLLSKSKSDP